MVDHSNYTRTITIGGKIWYRSVFKEGGMSGTYSEDEMLRSLLIHYTPLSRNGMATRLFTCFNSYQDFLGYATNIEQKNWHFYETIIGDKCQKPKFDIDIPGGTDNVINVIIDRLVESINQTLASLGIRLVHNKDILLFQSHGDSKRSIHLVVNNYYHVNNIEARNFYEKVIDCYRSLYGEDYLCYIDAMVYSTFQQFRTLWSTKVGTKRHKSIVKNYTSCGVKYSLELEGDVSEQEELFRSSLITYTKNCMHIEGLVSVRHYCGQTELTDDAEIDKALSLMNTVMPNNPFVYDSVKDGYIIMKREAPSYCPVCDREHEKENPYIVMHNGIAYWNCRRSGINGSLLLGYVKNAFGRIIADDVDDSNDSDDLNRFVIPMEPVTSVESRSVESKEVEPEQELPDQEFVKPKNVVKGKTKKPKRNIAVPCYANAKDAVRVMAMMNRYVDE